MLLELDCDLLDGSTPPTQNPELAVIVPTYNERENIPLLLAKLRNTLAGIEWEVIFVDDDSPDGTSDAVRAIALHDRRVRLLQRVGRRGLSSACIEGMLATASPYIAVMDADLQHDDTILPKMLERLRTEQLDVVVATRNAAGGSMGLFGAQRVLLSRLGRWMSNSICRCNVSDPMSGFFLLRRTFLLNVVHRLNGHGFKILLDLLSSPAQPVRVGEVGYRFGARLHGKSKLDLRVGFEYIAMVIEKLSRGWIGTRFLEFSAIGGIGVLVHFAVLGMLYSVQHAGFMAAQAAATAVAMVSNFFLNDLITFRDRKLKGAQKVFGFVTFCVGCTFGLCANVSFAQTLLGAGLPWYLAALSGILVSSGWNYSVSSLLTWRKAQSRPVSRPNALTESVPQS